MTDLMGLGLAALAHSPDFLAGSKYRPTRLPSTLINISMKKSILKLLSATALLACAAAPSFAGTIKAANFDLYYNDSFIPVSYVGNTITFVSTFYFTTYGNPNAVLREAFYAWAHAGQAFTGDVAIKTGLEYTLGNYQGTASSYNAFLNTTIDVLSPNCANCSIYDAKMLSQGNVYTSGTANTPRSGTATGAIDLTNAAGGTYQNLALYVINDYNLNPASGMMHLNRFTVTLDTVGPSAVPELPPVAMLGLGLAALGLRARFGGRKTKAKATLAA